MPKYSEQDLKYASELRSDIHKEALEIVRKTFPNASDVVDYHTVEDYFQESWDYPGKWYSIVAIPYGYKSRQALVDTIVRNTLSEREPNEDVKYTNELKKSVGSEQNRRKQDTDPFYQLLDEYPDLVIDYCIVKDEQYCGYESHLKALKSAYGILSKGWEGNPNHATGKRIFAEEMFSSQTQRGKLNYREAFLYPPHENSYNSNDFARINAALFPNGTDILEVYEWDTDWSDYFDDGHEWWGALCLTIYDKSIERFVVIMASATD